MTYCSAEDVARYNIARGTYTASTKPTATQVSLFINEVAGEIDTRLRKAGYSVPVASVYTTDFEFLRGVNAVGAAWKVEVSAETSDNEGMYKSMYQSALRMLDSVELLAPKDSAQSSFRHGFSQGPVLGVPSHIISNTEF